MEGVNGRLTVFFEDPFWVGVFEHSEDGKMAVCRVVFGSEPQDGELHEFVLKKWKELVFSEPILETNQVSKKPNPKRIQRLVRKETQIKGIGTKAQQALKAQMEMSRQERKQDRTQKNDLEEARHFQIRQQKRKEKHKGH